MNDKIRVLHVLGQLNIGGAESRIMDLYRVIDKDKVQFDFAVHGNTKGYFEDEVVSMGGRIFRLPRFKAYNMFEYKQAWRKLLDSLKGEVSFVQGHMTSTASIYLPIAHTMGMTTIAHARSAGVDAGMKGRLTRFLRRNLSKKADYLFTCSEIAGISVFGRTAVEEGRTIFVPNCIDVSKFKYNYETRIQTRKELNADENHIYGHVGRFHYAKNHEYLLKVFSEILQRDAKAVLILLGEGPRMQEMQELAQKLEIDKRVLFLGNKIDAYKYYQAMDCFVYPSRYEGLPGTVVEAQASGLPVLMSDEICDEVAVTDLIHTLSIKDDPKVWADLAVKCCDAIDSAGGNHSAEAEYDCDGVNRSADRRSKYNTLISEAGFEVHDQAEKFTEFYGTKNTGVFS